MSRQKYRHHICPNHRIDERYSCFEPDRASLIDDSHSIAIMYGDVGSLTYANPLYGASLRRYLSALSDAGAKDGDLLVFFGRFMV
jgi:hypothetical protein